MRFARWFVVAIAITFSAWAGAQEAASTWDDVESLRELPAGVQALLGVGLGSEGIADRGERFNATDVAMDDVPTRRFVLGIAQGDTVVVAIERGGRGYSVRIAEFREDDSTWTATRCAVLFKLPQRGAELLDALATHPASAYPECRAGGGRVPSRTFRPQPAS